MNFWLVGKPGNIWTGFRLFWFRIALGTSLHSPPSQFRDIFKNDLQQITGYLKKMKGKKHASYCKAIWNQNNESKACANVSWFTNQSKEQIKSELPKAQILFCLLTGWTPGKCLYTIFARKVVLCAIIYCLWASLLSNFWRASLWLT